MSINITVHGKPTSVFKEKHLLFNPELAKKIETEQRKKLRLEQVREQSKEFASQIRNRVNEERKKQLNKYEVTRTNELKKWQKGKLEKAQDGYSAAISSVGEAHTAALNEANANVIREAIKAKNDSIAAQRGREASAILKKRENISLPKKTFISRDIKNKTLKEQDILENKEHKSPVKVVKNKVKNIVKKTSPSRIEKPVINKHIYPDVEIEHTRDSDSDTELSELNTPGKQYKNLTSKKLTRLDESSELEHITLVTDEEDLFTTKGKNDKISPKKQKPHVTKQPYNPNDYRATSTSPDSKHSPNKQAANIKPFTQVTDLLQRRSRKVSRETSDYINNITSGNTKNLKDNKINLEKTIIDSKNNVEIDKIIKSPIKTVTVNKISSPKKSDVPKVNKDKLISSNSNKNDNQNLMEKNSPSIKSNKQLQNQYNKHTIKSQIENINPNEPSKINTRLIVKKPPFISSTKTSITNNDNSNKKLSSVDRYSHSTKTDYTNKSENKVQYYDHENRFSKEYIPPESLVIRSESQVDEKNAMEEAQIFVEAQKIRSQQLDDLRQRESIRSIKALEKVEMRKEYDLLTTQLEELAKKENLTKSIMNYKNIDEITRKMANERQKKLNEAFKKIGHQPVIITTPTIHEETPNYSYTRFNNHTNTELNVADLHDDTHEEHVNSSDSCASILLGYVNNQSVEISQQINKMQTINPQDDNNNVNKLRDLLIRINKQKSLLLNELKNNDSIPAKSMTKVLESLKNIEKEKDLIVMLEPKSKNKKDSKCNEKEMKLKNDLISLEQREKLLKEKEQQIDKKMLQLYETEKKQKKLDEIENYIKRINVNQLKASRNIEVEADKNAQQRVEVIQEVCTSSNDQDADNVNIAPIKIIIKVNDQLRKKAFKSPKRRSLYKKSLEKNSKSPCKSYPKTPKRKSCTDKSESIEVMKNKLLKSTAAVLQIPYCKQASFQAPPPTAKSTSEMSVTSASTQYRSPPDQVKTTLSQFLFKQKMENDGKFSKCGEKNQLKNRNLNPSLVHYITRLLGMSRQSIDQLGVSTSTDVSTPGDSVINVTGNISMDSSTDNRMERLKKFIDENYSFLSDLEESLKEECISDSYEQKMKEIEKIWMIMLKKKEKEMEASKLRRRNEDLKQIEKKLKPALKNWKKSNTQTEKKDPCCCSANTNVEADPLQKNILIKDAAKNIISLADEIDDEVAEKYNKMTETCNQRIADLASMIEKVRQEKHRLLESSNFSGSDQIEQSTEYMEFAQRNTGSVHSCDTSRIDANNREELIHDAVGMNRLEGNRLIGLSKDSGISISRPLTATGMRDSPEVRQDGTREFEPLLKDIPKVFCSRRLNEETIENNTIKEKSDDVLAISSNNIFAARKYAGELTSSSGSLNIQTYKDVQMQKRTKPVSSRYSPIMDQAPIHELSTIIEVDTPAASKINTSICMDDQSFAQDNTKAQATQTNLCGRNYSLEITNKSEVITHDKFLTYEEYVKQQKLDCSGNKKDVEKILEEEITELEYRRFPTRREYNQAQGITDHVDSQCLDSVDEVKLDNDSKNSSSNSSLPDVVAELKRRNVLQESFHNEINDTNRSTRVSECLNKIFLKGNETPKQKTENKNAPISPRKRQIENKTGPRTPQKKVEEKKSKGPHTPTKNKPHSVARSPRKNHSHDMSGFDVLQKSSDSGKQLEQELSNMGLNWAATMMKKIQESHTISSTSDSSSKHTLPKRKSPKKKSIHDSKDNAAVQTLLDSNIAREAIKIKERAENEDSGSEESLSETKPLNLKQFLARELMRRTNTDVHTSTNDESSSLASQFLRSLMQTSLNASPLNTVSKTGQQRTSTPVFTKSTSTSQDDKPNASSGLFSGVSRISSVRFSSSEPSHSHSVEKKSDSLMVPNLKLNLDKYKQSTSNESSNSSS